jgi:transglutaminase-like putative cysteine protease
MFLRKPILFLLFIAINAFSQEDLSVLSIPAELKENANAVIRSNHKEITISSRKSMTVKTSRTVTVLNDYGDDYADASEFYDKSIKIKSIEAVIYDAFGKEIKKVKKRDFRDRSAVSEGSILTDDRVLYLDYTPVQYPYTVVYTSETETSNTAFIAPWLPVEGLYVSTQKSVVAINYDTSLGFKYKDYNFEDGVLNKQEQPGRLVLSAENLPAHRSEDYSPYFFQIMPHVLFGLDKFNLEGVDGEASSWETFGNWMYSNLIKDTAELPEETVAKIKSLTAGASTPLEKAKIVYQYMQGKTRYISVQLGIGGWKPMPAKDVDRLGYGDCKALTNYTRALLQAVGVESYYAVVYGDRRARNLREDFVSMQGNHVILAIPNNNDLVWLECTSQQLPFGFQGSFTDDRTALLVKPEKSELVRTHVYDDKSNFQESKGAYTLFEDGAITGNVTFTSAGLQYNDKYDNEFLSPDDLDRKYKNRFSYINNIRFKDISIKNNKDSQLLTEVLAIEAAGYGNISGNRMIFAINAFNQSMSVPQRYRDRKTPFEISTGYYDTDEITINLPQGFTVEAKPESITVKDKFGEYKAEYTMVGSNQVIYKRSMHLYKGRYDSTEYENYRQFCDKIARNDNAKMVLIKQ